MAHPSGTPQFVDEQLLPIGDVDFHCGFPLGAGGTGRLAVLKSRDLVEHYIELSKGMDPKVVVELGIFQGGSTALLAELFAPEKLIAVEVNEIPPPALTGYLERRGMSEIVRPYYGVDQSDRARISEILDRELGGRTIDLVIDDASHRYQETRASFEILFPRLAPGGTYVIEDWPANHRFAEAMSRRLEDETRADHAEYLEHFAERYEALLKDPGQVEIPLTQLAIELVVARTSLGDAIREVTVNRYWIVIRRGADALDRDAFRLWDLIHDHFGFTAVMS